ncbi:beta strand repeat-containing protein, partial [Phenylobacterium aquaticum]|uniref:beta strand repeat-containing protein n=1 Tax=Phenylobacterium aquaticum TaxID=1763816 RepID=UPI0034CEC70E
MSRKKAPHLQSQLWSRAAPALAGLTAIAAGFPAGAGTSISTATTTPVATSTVNGGAADDITVTSDGTIKPASGVAVTLDSNNSVSNAGTIYYRDVDNVTDVLLLGGHTGSFSNTGTLEADETHTDTDSNGDGNYDGVFATGTGRYGLRLTGTSPFVGDISLSSGSVINIRGNDSAGVSLEAALQGTLLNVGSITAVGDRVFGVHAMSTISGDVALRGSVSTTGLGAVAVQLDDNVGGQLLVQSAIVSTGYRYTSRSSTQSVLDALGADDLLQGGSALVIKGDVAGGVLLEIPPTLDSTNTDVDGDGYTDTAEGSASVVSYGAAPAIVIGASGRTVTLGDVGTNGEAYGFVNRGAIAGAGVYDGVSATGLQVGVAGGLVNLTGGLSNQGSIGASSYDADATAVHFLSGASAYTIVDAGSMTATQTGDTAHSATGLLIDAGASTPNLIISKAHSIGASIVGVTGTSTVGGNATAIRDLSGSLTSIINNGFIA